MKNKPVILIIDDNPGDIRLIKEAFKESSLQATLSVVYDGLIAEKYLNEAKLGSPEKLPNLILLDLNIPKKNGLEILAQIKADETLKRIPVLILSSSKNPNDIAKAYDLHANCFLTKPVDFEPFFKIVKAVEYFWLQLAKLPHSSNSESISSSHH